MEPIEYAARAIARDIMTLIRDEARSNNYPLGQNKDPLLNEITAIARSHILTFVQTLPRQEDIMLYEPYCNPIEPLDQQQDSRTLKDILLHSLSTDDTLLSHESRQTSLNNSSTLDKLIRDLTLNVQPRSASMTLPSSHKPSFDPSEHAGSHTYSTLRANSSSTLRSSFGATVSRSPYHSQYISPVDEGNVGGNETSNVHRVYELTRGGEVPLISLSSPPTDESPQTTAASSLGIGEMSPRGKTKQTSRRRDGEPWEDDYHRMVFVSWIPRQLRVQNGGDKRKAEVNLKKLLRTELQVEGLNKVLLFPPKGTHCKLVFESASSAAKFINSFGGQFGSDLSEKWKVEICKACRLEMNDHAFSTTSVTIEWAQPHYG